MPNGDDKQKRIDRILRVQRILEAQEGTGFVPGGGSEAATQETIRLLGATGGVGRAAATQVAELATGEELVTPGETISFLKTIPGGEEVLKKIGMREEDLEKFPPREFPFTEELLERAGVPDFPGRGALGFAGDIASESLGAFGVGALAKGLAKGVAKGGAKAIGRIGLTKTAKELVNKLPPSFAVKVKSLSEFATPAGAIKKAGEKLYESGIVPIIVDGEKVGKKFVSQTFRKHGIAGGAGTISKKAKKVADKLSSSVDDVISQAENAGATVNRKEAFQPLFDEVFMLSESLADNPQQVIDAIGDKNLTEEGAKFLLEATAEAARKARAVPPAQRLREIDAEEAINLLETFLGEKLIGADPNLTVARKWKSRVNKGVPKVKRLENVSPDLKARLSFVTAGGLKEAIENSVSRSLGPEVAQKFAQQNAELGTILTVQDSIQRMKNAAQKRDLLTSFDLMLLFGAGSRGQALFTGKKIGDIVRGPRFKTLGGRTLERLSTPASATVRESIRRSLKEEE